jgi:hypothetical protein
VAVKRDIDGLPLGCWQPVRAVLWATVFILTLAWASDAPAQDRKSECAMLWDAALVARSLAEDKLPQQQIIRIMKRMYGGQTEIIDVVVQLAIASPLPTAQFAAAIRQRCLSLAPAKLEARISRGVI